MSIRWIEVRANDEIEMVKQVTRANLKEGKLTHIVRSSDSDG